MSMYCIMIGTRAHALVRLYENNETITFGSYNFDQWREFRAENSSCFEVLSVDIFFDEVVITLMHK